MMTPCEWSSPSSSLELSPMIPLSPASLGIYKYILWSFFHSSRQPVIVDARWDQTRRQTTVTQRRGTVLLEETLVLLLLFLPLCLSLFIPLPSLLSSLSSLFLSSFLMLMCSLITLSASSSSQGRHVGNERPYPDHPATHSRRDTYYSSYFPYPSLYRGEVFLLSLHKMALEQGHTYNVYAIQCHVYMILFSQVSHHPCQSCFISEYYTSTSHY